MSKLIKNGIQLYDAAKKDFFKLKYGYQVVRLAHYSRQFKEAVTYYDRYIAGIGVKSILQQLALSLKAGALLRMGNKQESGYLFSKAFANSPVKRLSNYLGLFWGSINAENKSEYFSYCKNDAEKANLLGMMSIFGTKEEFASMKEGLGRGSSGGLDRFYDVHVPIWAELGRVELPLGELVRLSEGAVVRLERPISEPVDVVSQGVKLARGEVIVIDDCFAMRIKEIIASK